MNHQTKLACSTMEKVRGNDYLQQKEVRSKVARVLEAEMRSRRVRSEAAKGEASEFANGDLGAKNLRPCSKIAERERRRGSFGFEKSRGAGRWIWNLDAEDGAVSNFRSHEPRATRGSVVMGSTESSGVELNSGSTRSNGNIN